MCPSVHPPSCVAHAVAKVLELYSQNIYGVPITHEGWCATMFFVPVIIKLEVVALTLKFLWHLLCRGYLSYSHKILYAHHPWDVHFSQLSWDVKYLFMSLNSPWYLLRPGCYSLILWYMDCLSGLVCTAITLDLLPWPWYFPHTFSALDIASAIW